MRRVFIVFLFFLLRESGDAQVLISLQIPPTGVLTKPQLWNFSLINSSANVMDIQLELIMRDMSNNAKVMTASTRVFKLQKGLKQILPIDVMPVIYNVNNPGYGINNSPDGFLPIGNFEVCVMVNNVNEISEQITQDCINLQVEPLSPPLLVLPSDGEELLQPRPLFTWVPPAPYNLFNNLQYDWTLVEVRATQTASDAIQHNIPILSQNNIGVTNLQYPSSAPALDTSKLYAWRITAKNNISPIANSDTWTFTLKKSKTELKDPNAVVAYRKLKSEEDASFTICYGILAFEYINESNDLNVKVKAFDISNSKRTQVNIADADLPVHLGQNFLQVDLKENKGFLEKHIYLLEVTSMKGEKSYLKFEFRKAS